MNERKGRHTGLEICDHTHRELPESRDATTGLSEMIHFVGLLR